VDPITAFWHIIDFFLPAVGVGAVAAALAKLLWRRELAAARWLRLALWAAAAAALVLFAGLVVFGRDGKIATYAAMVVVAGVTLWWAGFGARRA